MFSRFSKWVSTKVGSPFAFIFSLILIVVWLVLGPFFNYSDTWQLVINTLTTIITFLMVFLIQNTQNRESIAVHLKLDELIRAIKTTHNELLKVEEIPDEELKSLLEQYENLALDIRKKIKHGDSVTGIPEISIEDAGSK